jgi:hypothetical protein
MSLRKKKKVCEGAYVHLMTLVEGLKRGKLNKPLKDYYTK